MTKQEAIDLLDNLIGFVEDSQNNDYDEALKMAVEALTHFNSTSNSIKNELNELSCSAFPNSSEPKTAESGSVDSEMPEIETDRTTSGDLISRQDAIDAFEPEHRQDWYTPKIIETLEALPSAQPEPHWIPCSERLPEDEQPILFSTTTGRVHQGRFHKDNSVNRWYSSLDKMRAYNNVVNAWMPLPEPYREDDYDHT